MRDVPMPGSVAQMRRDAIRRRCEREGDYLFTRVNIKHSRIFFALAMEGRYAIPSSTFTSRFHEPDSHDGWIRGKGIPLFHRFPSIDVRRAQGPECSLGWPCLGAGSPLNFGGCF